MGHNLTVMTNRGTGCVETDASKTNLMDSTYELIIMFDLDDPRLSNRSRSTLFQALKTMLGAEHGPQQCSNMDRLLAYYNTPSNKRKPIQPKYANLVGYIRATHILLYWDAITPEARRPLKDNPLDVFMVPRFDSGLDCFMLYERADNYVHVLNWNVRHVAGTDNRRRRRRRRRVKKLVESVNYLKRRYLDPRHDAQFLRLDIFPILDTLFLFGVVLGFEINYSDLMSNEPNDAECVRLVMQFRQVMRNPTRRGLRGLVREPRYLTKLPNGNMVMRLYYYPTLCSCTLTMEQNAQICAGHCAQCGEIYYCTDACKQWLRCCEEEETVSSSDDDDDDDGCKK